MAGFEYLPHRLAGRFGRCFIGQVARRKHIVHQKGLMPVEADLVGGCFDGQEIEDFFGERFEKPIEAFERQQEASRQPTAFGITPVQLPFDRRRQADLAAASALAPAVAQALQADLHNAWASYHYQRQDKTAELEHRLQAWLAAVETGDSERMMKTAHNLGQAYAWRGAYEQGLDYLGKSLALAEEAGNQQLIGANRKTRGNIYFWQEEWALAEAEYLAAHALFVQMGSRNWQGYLAYELAELYATRARWGEARPFWETGQQIAAEIGNEMLASGLRALGEQFPLLAERSDLNERQEAALVYVREHGRVTNRDYCDLTDCASVTAARDLKEMVEKGVLVVQGKGRGTFYALPE